MRRLRIGGLLLLLSVLALPARHASADEPAADAGPLLFARAADWVRGTTSTPPAPVQRLRVELLDVTARSASGGNHDGNFRLWLDLPHRFRWEIRNQRRVPAHKRVTKLLDGSKLWIYEPPPGEKPMGRWVAKHGRPDGAGAIEQMQKDRDMFAGLARYLTLQGLSGQGVRFSDAGKVTFEKGHHLAGTWRKVKRVDAQGRRMAFLFEEVAIVATKPVPPQMRPRAVLIPGDKQRGTETEHIVFDKWRLLRGRQVPQRVLRWTRGSGPRFRRTLHARIADLEINPTGARWPASLFRDPTATSGKAAPSR